MLEMLRLFLPGSHYLTYLALQYWGQLALTKIVGVIGKPLRTNRATSQKDIFEFARVLVEVSINQDFPNEIMFYNEKGKMISQ